MNSLASAKVYKVDPANHLPDQKTMRCQKEDIIGLEPGAKSTIEDPEQGFFYTAFLICVFLPALAFFAAVVGETRIRMIGLEKDYHLQKQARKHMENKLAQLEDDKLQLGLNLWENDQALRDKEEQQKASLENAKELREKLALSDHNEILLRKDLAASKENIKGLQATVAKKGKEALEYRPQAYRPTHENIPAHMSRMRFGGNQKPAHSGWPSAHTQTNAQAQSGYPGFSETEVDAGGRNLHTGGTRETLGRNGLANRDVPRPAW